MSLSSIFTNLARGGGLRSQIGTFAHGSTDYGHVHQRSLLRHQRADALRSGREVGGFRLDGAPAAQRPALAQHNAHALDWAEFYEGRYGAGAGKAFLKMVLDAAKVDGEAGDGTSARADSTVPMASQGLTYFLPEVYQFRHAELPCWNESILKIYRGVAPAANEYVWYEADNVGIAKVANSYSITDIPMVNGPLANDNVGKIVPAMIGYEMNFMDPRREALAASMGKPDFQVEVMKREACERAIAEFFEALWFAGDGSLGIDGLMMNPIVETLSVATAWSGMTALQLLDSLKTIVWSIPNRTQGSLGDFNRLKVILPPEQYQLISTTPVTAAGSTSVLTFFLESFRSGDNAGRGVPKITFEYKFAASNSAAYNGGPNVLARDTAVVVYEEGNPNKDPTFVLSQPIEVPAPVRQTGVGDVTYYHARGGGLKLPDAQRLLYVAGL